MNIFKNKVTMITGGGAGIGKALAIELSRLGAVVHITDINAESAEQAAKECGINTSFELLDVSDATQVHNTVNTLHQKHGKIDYLFNNAGIGTSGEVQNIQLKDWDRIIDINIKGVINGISACYPLMIKQGFGHIINTSSIAGLGSAPLLTAYAMTKHAIVGLTNSLRVEASHYGVKVCVLCPGSTDTALLDTGGGVNVRRFLSNWTGTPYTAERIAKDAIKEIERNVGVIVVPKKVRFFWTIMRFFPAFAEMVSIKAHRKELQYKADEAL